MFGSRSSSSKGTAGYEAISTTDYCCCTTTLRNKGLASETVCNIYSALVRFPQQYTNNTLLSILSDSIVVIYNTKQHQWVHNHEIVCRH